MFNDSQIPSWELILKNRKRNPVYAPRLEVPQIKTIFKLDSL